MKGFIEVSEMEFNKGVLMNVTSIELVERMVQRDIEFSCITIAQRRITIHETFEEVKNLIAKAQ